MAQHRKTFQPVLDSVKRLNGHKMEGIRWLLMITIT